jgi:DNA-binding PadR family transcriptional regulator
MSDDHEHVDALLPLQPATFHILLALAAEDRHGYGIILEVETRTGGAVRLSPGTLYSAIHRLLEQGLIVERRKAAGRAIDPRRRYYGITPFGTAVARAETRRLAQLVRMARGVGLLAPEPS